MAARKQPGTNNTWRAAQRQLGSVVKAGPLNESARVAQAGSGAQRRTWTPMESMRPDRSSPSPVLAWYRPIPAYSQPERQRQCQSTDSWKWPAPWRVWKIKKSEQQKPAPLQSGAWFNTCVRAMARPAEIIIAHHSASETAWTNIQTCCEYTNLHVSHHLSTCLFAGGSS